MRSTDVDVRQAAAYVLSEIASASTVRPLATFGISDADHLVRYYAVSGLIAAAGGSDAPSLDLYQQSELAYLQQWRDWARRNGY